MQMEDGLGPNLQVWGADHHQADPHDLAWDLLAERTCSAILPGRRGISAGPLGMSRQAQPLAPGTKLPRLDGLNEPGDGNPRGRSTLRFGSGLGTGQDVFMRFSGRTP